jgi:hypothetical protein
MYTNTPCSTQPLTQMSQIVSSTQSTLKYCTDTRQGVTEKTAQEGSEKEQIPEEKKVLRAKQNTYGGHQ